MFNVVELLLLVNRNRVVLIFLETIDCGLIKDPKKHVRLVHAELFDFFQVYTRKLEISTWEDHWVNNLVQLFFFLQCAAELAKNSLIVMEFVKINGT